MTELKTLKDLKKDDWEEGRGKLLEEYHYVFIKELRQEAIKWVKALRINKLHRKSDSFNWNTGTRDRVLTNEEKKVLDAWIKHFFNITEDEVE